MNFKIITTSLKNCRPSYKLCHRAAFSTSSWCIEGPGSDVSLTGPEHPKLSTVCGKTVVCERGLLSVHVSRTEDRKQRIVTDIEEGCMNSFRGS